MQQAQMKDLEHVLSLYRACAALPTSCWDEEYPGEELARSDIEQGFLYLLEDYGAATLLQWDDLEDMNLGFEYTEKPCVLCRLCLHPDHQGRGEGKLLLAHVEEQARQLGYQSMHLLVDVDNPIARRVYDRAGYRQVNQTELYDCVFDVMEKRL